MKRESARRSLVCHTPIMKVTYFGAGLGDVIRSIYLREGYRLLSETTEPMAVIVASHNPYSIEIFRHHKNNSKFVLYDLGHKFDEFLHSRMDGSKMLESLVTFAGHSMDDLVLGKSDGYDPIFHAPDEIASHGHIVFCPFAGSTGARTFTREFTVRVLEVLKRSGRAVYLVSRDFPRIDPRGRVIHGSESTASFASENVICLNNLSVPASINLVKNSAAYVGSWTSLQQAAWFANKPVAVFYPPNWSGATKASAYAFGIDRPDCHHSDYESFDESALRVWLGRLSTFGGLKG